MQLSPQQAVAVFRSLQTNRETVYVSLSTLFVSEQQIHAKWNQAQSGVI